MEKTIPVNTDQRYFPVHHSHGFAIGCLNHPSYQTISDVINFHWVQEFQYHYVTKGSFLFQVGDKKVILSEGEGIFINSERVHRILSLSPESTSLFLSFHPHLISNEPSSDLFENFVAPVLQKDRIAFFTFSKEDKRQRELSERVQQIYELSLQKDCSTQDLLLYSQFILLWRITFLYLTQQQARCTRVDPFLNQRLQNIFQYIEEHYEENITLEDVAHSIHLSSSECSRFFRRTVGEPLFRYIISYRVQQSMKRLLHTDLSIAEIAEQVGFNSQSYFTTRFSELKQITPQQFRKEFRRMKEESEMTKEIYPH